jgi:hypothetical protein
MVVALSPTVPVSDAAARVSVGVVGFGTVGVGVGVGAPMPGGQEPERPAGPDGSRDLAAFQRLNP